MIAIVLVHQCSAVITHVTRKSIKCSDTSAGMSTQSLCVYTESCSYDWKKLSALTAIETSGSTKTITCTGEGVVLPLVYTYNSVEKECTYSLSTRVPYSGQLHVVIDKIPANLVWNASFSTDTVRTNPHLAISGNRDVCALLRNHAEYECIAPLVRSEPPSNVLQTTWDQFCQPIVQAQINCGVNSLECALAPSMTDYTCLSANLAVAPPSDVASTTAGINFGMKCTHVSPLLVGMMLNSSRSACQTMGRQCVQRIADRDFARALAILTSTTYISGDYEYDSFTCNLPALGPFNTTLCELPNAFTETSTDCFGRSIACYSETGQTGQHTCVYGSRVLSGNPTALAADLHVQCTIPQVDVSKVVAPEYALDDQIASSAGLGLEATRHHATLFASTKKVSAARQQSSQSSRPPSPRQQHSSRPTIAHTTLTLQKHLLPMYGWSFESIVAGHRVSAVAATAATASSVSVLSTKMKLSSVSQQAAYTGLFLTKATADQKLCSYLLQTCGPFINCTSTTSAQNVSLSRSRSTYCTQYVPSSCIGFGMSPIPSNWQTTSQQLVRCRKNSAGDLHDILCSPISTYTGASCYLWCRVSDAESLTLSAWPVRMSAVLTTNLTASSICSAIYNVAVNSASDTTNVLADGSAPPSNAFVCQPPFVSLSSTDMCIDPSNGYIPSGQSVPFALANEYIFDCGDMTIQCDRNSGDGSAAAPTSTASVTYHCFNQSAISQDYGLYLDAPVVSNAIVAARDCLAIRAAAGSAFACPSAGRINSATVFCRHNVTRTSFEPTLVLSGCGGGVAGDLDMTCVLTNNATRLVTHGPEYACVGSTLDRFNNSYAAYLGSSAASAFQFNNSISCLHVGAYRLNSSRTTLERCMTLKRQCDQGAAAQNHFRCSPRRSFYAQSNTSGFCNRKQLPRPFSNSRRIVATCGQHISHQILCTSQTTSAAYGWLRCNVTQSTFADGSSAHGSSELASGYASNYLDLDCLVRETLVDRALDLAREQSLGVNATNEKVCDVLRQTCGLPIVCDESIEFCPTSSEKAASHLTCNAPAQMCEGYFCQVDSNVDSSSVDGSGFLVDASQNIGVCQFVPQTINVTCEGFRISCFKRAGDNAPSSATFECLHDYQTVDGFLSESRDLFMDCDGIPFTDFIESQPYHTCLRIGRRCLALTHADTNYTSSSGLGGVATSTRGVALACSMKWLATSEQPFCTIPSKPADTGSVFTCDNLVVSCVPDVDKSRTLCSSLTNSKVWVLGPNRDRVAYPSRAGASGCIVQPSTFYTNAATRCAVIHATCQHSCLPGHNHVLTSNSTLNPQFCQDQVDTKRTYLCEQQRIVCELPSGVSSVAPASQTVSSTDMERFALDAEALRNARQLRCYAPSSVEGLVLDCLVDKNDLMLRTDTCSAILSECINNLGTISCRDPFIATPQHPFCSQQKPTGDDQYNCDCGVWWSGANNEGSLMAPDGLISLTCAKRGLFVYSQTTDQKKSEWWKQTWCVDNSNPAVATPICATRPGMGLPLCTVECVPGMVKTTIPWLNSLGVAEYCCRPSSVTGTSSCSDADDSRNCVLGQHDPSGGYAALTNTVPSRLCARNILNDKSTWPIVTTVAVPESGDSSDDDLPGVEDAIYADAKYACYSDPERCQGFTVFVDTTLTSTGFTTSTIVNAGGIYYWSRYPGFSVAHRTALDPSRQHALDSESVYSLHNFKDSQASMYASAMSRVSTGTRAESFVIERNNGYACKDRRIDAAYLLDNNQKLLSLTQDRVNKHLLRLGAGSDVISQMFYPTMRESIKVSRLQFTTVNGDFVYAPLLVVNLTAESIQDLSDGLGNGTPEQVAAAIALARTTTANTTTTGANAPLISYQMQQSEATARALQPNFDALSYSIPLFGRSDTLLGHAAVNTGSGTAFRKLVTVNQGSDPFINIASGSSEVTKDTTVVGWFDILQPNVRKVKFASFYELFLYFAARVYILHGDMRTFDTERWSPNSQCTLSTPLWSSAVPDLYCAIPNAPLRPDPDWDWGVSLLPPSDTVVNPNPALADIQRRHDIDLPCSGRGVVKNGQCLCEPSFLASTGMIGVKTTGGVRRVQTSLMAIGCAIDVRNKCNNPSRGVVTSCSGHGECVIGFVANRQTALCQCGSFPIDPDKSQDRTGSLTCNQLPQRTCEIHNLEWVNGGFEGGSGSEQNLCTVPRVGCRSNPTVCRRDGGLEYVRGDCYGCEYPKGDSRIMATMGDCRPEAVIPASAPDYDALSASMTWSCVCKPGQYGNLCQYVTLNQGCYDSTVESTLRRVGSISSTGRETLCVWNSETAQYESESETTIADSALVGLVRVSCRGVECSGNGVCSHRDMNNLALDDLVRQPAPLTTTVSRIKLRRTNQTCTCRNGWTGKFCQTRTCLGGCGAETDNNRGFCKLPANNVSDPRIQPTCTCPRRSDGKVLVLGARCEGIACNNRGVLVRGNIPFVNATCACTPPYYQGPQTTAICGDICAPPGQIVAERITATRNRTICSCTFRGVKSLCSDLSANILKQILIDQNTTAAVSSSTGGGSDTSTATATGSSPSSSSSSSSSTGNQGSPSSSSSTAGSLPLSSSSTAAGAASTPSSTLSATTIALYATGSLIGASAIGAVSYAAYTSWFKVPRIKTS